MATARPRTDQLSWAADQAREAPSIFNTQPWHWRIADDQLELWAAPDRHLTVIDPYRRLLTLSCGVALHHARVALAAAGERIEVRRWPDPGQPDLYARIAIKGPATATERDRDRLRAIPRRHTDRRPFAGDPVPASLLARLRRAAEEEDTQLYVLGPTDLPVLAGASTHAARIEVSDPAYRAELGRWTYQWRWSNEGVPERTAPDASRRRVPLREFYLSGRPEEPRSRQVDEDRAATYVVAWGDGDRLERWLRAGEAVSAVLLDATVAGVATSPMSDLIEVADSRAMLRTHLLAGAGDPYLVVRLGYATDEPPSPSPRRTRDTVIDDETP